MPSRGRIYRQSKDGVPYGSFRFYIPAFAGRKPRTMTLDTTDVREAEKKAQSILDEVENAIKNVTQEETSREPPPEPVNPAPQDPTVVLDEWARVTAPVEPDGGETSSGAQLPRPTASATSEAPREKTRRELMSERTPAIAAALCKLVTSVNVAAVGLTVRAFGRMPEEPAEADRELLELGWKLQFEEMLYKKPLEPWMLIVAASGGLGVTMWINGEPMPKDEDGVAS